MKLFIRKRQSSRNPSFQVIETYREDGKVRQRVLANLRRFPTIEEALHHHRNAAARCEAEFAINAESYPWRGLRYRTRQGEKIRSELKRHQDRIAQLEALCGVKMCRAGSIHFDTTSATADSAAR